MQDRATLSHEFVVVGTLSTLCKVWDGYYKHKLRFKKGMEYDAVSRGLGYQGRVRYEVDGVIATIRSKPQHAIQ